MIELALLIEEIINKTGWSIERIAEEAEVPGWAIQNIIKKEELPIILFTEYSNKLKDLSLKFNYYSNIKNKSKKIKSSLSNEKKEDQPWSKKYLQCVNCGTTEVKHIARGLCLNCYRIYNENNQKKHTKKKGYASSVISEAYLIELYNKDRKSLGEIAEHFSCSRQYIHKMMKAYKIPLRSKKTARDLALEKGKLVFQVTDENGNESSLTLKKVEIDHNFFKSWSPEMAWVLGVIYSDGNIYFNPNYSEDKRLQISQKEPELLQKVKALMKCNVYLRYTPKRISKGITAGELYTLAILKGELIKDLLKLGITPRKSLDVVFPIMPKEYVRHFIRGCWDGDGSVYLLKRDKNIKASFVSGSLNFIQGMLSEFEKAGFEKKTLYTSKRSKNPSYYFVFSTSQCIQLYHYFYDDVPPSQYLERKYMIFKKYFETH